MLKTKYLNNSKIILPFMKSKILNKTPQLTKISSKGQIVIPQDYRKKLGIEEGNVFAVSSPREDMIVLKRIKNPLVEEDLAILKNVEEAWKEIERGEAKKSSKEEFLRDLEKW